jgi:hypothetical protein
VTPKAPAKAPKPKTPEKAAESTADVQEAEVAPAMDDQMKANFLSDLEKAKKAHRIAKGAMTAAQARCSRSTRTCFSREQVRVEQDCQQADGKQPLRQPSR